jgi:HNH endonuclease
VTTDYALQARFWSKTSHDLDTGCINWNAYRNPRGGYGRFKRHGKLEVAHRVAYELAGGTIPADLTLDHLCRNTRCVNPLHLEPVTVAENIRRGTQGWQQRATTHCPRGHAYDETNTYMNPRGQRLCRTCGRDRMRERRRQWQK